MNIFKSSTNIFENRKDEYVNKPRNQFKSYNNTTPKVSQKKDFEIKENEFPELSSPIKNNQDNTKSFSYLLKKEELNNVIKIEEKTEETVPVGWSMYKYSKLNNNFLGKCSKLTFKIENNFIDKNKETNTEKIMLNECEAIINALSQLHEKRSNKYKEDWGEDEWEKTFIFPNYDYEYFDKLDEAYEIEQNKINEEQYYDDYEYYEEYKKYDDY
jgi:hypothetical protein